MAGDCDLHSDHWAHCLFCLWTGGSVVTILTLQHVSKRFGSKQVLKDLNLTLPMGLIYGFVGENGAGKTTTMKLDFRLGARGSGED